MCIFKTKSELEKLQSQLNEVKLQAEKDEALVKQLQEENKKLQEEIAEHKRIKSLLLRKIETLMNDEPITEDKEFVIKEDKEFNAEDKEFITAVRRLANKTGDNEFIIKEDNDEVVKACEALEAQAVLLAKELLHLWAFREEHREWPLGGFSNIEWGGVSSNIVRGLQAYTKEGKITEEEQLDIDWTFDIFESYEGKL